MWAPQNQDHRQYAPANVAPGRNAAPARNRSQAAPAPRGQRNYSTPPSIAPRVDDRYRGARTNDSAGRPPPSAFQRRDSGGGRAAQPAPRRSGRVDSNNDSGSYRARPTYRARGESSRH
jgi:hypothetical protein